MRVHVESFASGQLVAVVDEAFAAENVAVFVEPGDSIGGPLGSGLPCAPDEDAGVLPGAELFVLYSPGSQGGYPNCDAFQACVADDCTGLAEPELPMCWESCSADTAEVCDQHRTAALLDGFFHWALPWGDSLDFGSGEQLPSSEIPLLYDSDACLERFPPPPPAPCDDTIEGGQCTVAPPRASPPGPALWLAALGFVVSAYRRHRRVKRTDLE